MSDQMPPDEDDIGGIADRAKGVLAGGAAASSGASASATRREDDEKLIAGAAMSGDSQIIVLGLIAAAFILFGSTVWGWFFGDSDTVESLGAGTSGVAASVQDDDGLSSAGDDGLSSAGAVASAAAVAAGDSDSSAEGNGEADDASIAAAPATTASPTTSAAPATTAAPTTEASTTTAAPATTAAPTTTAAPRTMWDALQDSGQAGQFAIVGGALGLQADLEALVDTDGNPVNRTILAPSDAALEVLDQAAIGALAADPAAAQALVGYHFLPEPLSLDELKALDGQSLVTRTGLPIAITVVDGNVVLNGSSTVVGSDFSSDNGVVHIIDTLLSPPTVNEVLALENIEFEVNSDVITAAGQAELQKAIGFFSEQPDVKAVIEGHTDTDGNDAANLDLSQRRAESVKAFLVANGLEGDRFTTEGFGETRPVTEEGVENKAASRRIEFVVR